MALNIKNEEVEQMIERLAAQTGTTKTEAVKVAVAAHLDRLGSPSPEERVRRLGERLEKVLRGRRFAPVTKEEWDEINEI